MLSDLTPTNHDLMELVRARVAAQYPMSFIAQELGVDVDDLCDWILRVYREPRKAKPYLNRTSQPLTSPRATLSQSQNAKRFANWRKAQEGAAKALEPSR